VWAGAILPPKMFKFPTKVRYQKSHRPVNLIARRSGKSWRPALDIFTELNMPRGNAKLCGIVADMPTSPPCDCSNAGACIEDGSDRMTELRCSFFFACFDQRSGKKSYQRNPRPMPARTSQAFGQGVTSGRRIAQRAKAVVHAPASLPYEKESASLTGQRVIAYRVPSQCPSCSP
jgi:hypothetical protein